jgi:hypothetical protein
LNERRVFKVSGKISMENIIAQVPGGSGSRAARHMPGIILDNT